MFKLLKNLIPGHDNNNGQPSMADNLPLVVGTLLLEIVQADDNIHPDEETKLKKIIQEQFSLSREESNELLRQAQQIHEDSIDIYPLTNMINQHYQTQQKCHFLELAWQIVFADGVLDQFEDHLMHKLATLLRLSHQQLIEAKLRARKALQQTVANRQVSP